MPIVKKKRVPEFRSEEEERQFWSEHDSTEFVDWPTAKRQKFPNLADDRNRPAGTRNVSSGPSKAK